MNRRGVGPRKLIAAAHKLSESPFDMSSGFDPHDHYSNLYCALLSEFKIGFEKHDYTDMKDEFEDLAHSPAYGIDFIYPGAKNYPDGLLRLADVLSFSPAFYTLGNSSLLTCPGVGVAGRRDASPVAFDAASKLAHEIANNGFNVVSGFARGVDSSAHLGALEAEGTTTVVVPFGLLSGNMRAIPEEFNRTRDVLFVSLFHPKSRFTPANAFSRNRLICALSRALVVIESGPERDAEGKSSGSFDTARQAFKAGIPVFVLTPSIFARKPEGNVKLLKLGAREFNPERGVGEIIEAASKSSPEPGEISNPASEEQMALFRP
ncbi:DNA-processing protein DprA [bacterium]|nr:DNA-processing protein DprA [bacterium]